MAQAAPPTILWLRRDLRLHDHAALGRALGQAGRVQPVFVFDTEILAQFPRKDDRRLNFIAATLTQLHRALQQRGGGLLVLHGKAREVMPKLVQVLGASSICAAEDYEPATRARDAEVGQAITPAVLHLVKDHVIAAPSDITRDGAAYKVFTPYAKAWMARLTPYDTMQHACDDHGRYADVSVTAQLARDAGLNVCAPTDALILLDAIGYRAAPCGEWDVTTAAQRLDNFAKHDLAAYATQRDRMDAAGTSKLSPYLRFGLVSVRECYRRVEGMPGAQKWINELIWREFYTMILFHYPHSIHEEWNPTYRGIEWRHDAALLQAWQEGRTGYPIVDAAMRQLLTTGWMHNRARMIVASFLTKDLLLDWRAGEAHFAQYLMDYELASNVGGWQWSASTGTDAQPYFRVFNPYLQSRKFDPDGAYIRRYVPELRVMCGDDIHELSPLMRPAGYPAPIVDHSVRRNQAIALFKAAVDAARQS
jgi:deoxyribodipyrimidine photo-lyase